MHMSRNTEILERYGIENQTRQAMEECGELIQALNKMLRLPSAENLNHLTEEMADVEIMMEQMRIAWQIPRIDIFEVKNHKLNRMMQRIKE